MAGFFGGIGGSRLPLNENDIENVLTAMGDGNLSDIDEFEDSDDDCDPTAIERLVLEGLDSGDVLLDQSYAEPIPDQGQCLPPPSAVSFGEDISCSSANTNNIPLQVSQLPSHTINTPTPDNFAQRSSTRSSSSHSPTVSSSRENRNSTRRNTANIQPVQPNSTNRSTFSIQNQPSTSRPDLWKETPFEDKPHNFEKPSVRPVQAPVEYFKEYFDDEFYELISLCTNNYFMRKSGRELKTSRSEIIKLFGIHIMMGCIPYPRVTMYWRAGIALEKITSKMSRDRFQALRNALHVVNTDIQPPSQEPNVLWKVQPIIDQVRNGCYKQERTPGYYSIDEQMIPFTGRCAVRQVVKNKPRPVGLKNFVLTTSSGLMLDFEIYKGAKTMFEETRLGLGPSVILHLARSVPVGSCLYHDRYFTTIPLIEELNKRGIHSTGTIMHNRIPDRTSLKFKKDSLMQRGESQQMVRDSSVLVKWKDNTTVTLASNCTGASTTDIVKRWDRKNRQYIDVPAPKIVMNYNKHMGGVDVLDQQMEYYRTFIKTKKWTLKVLIHFLDLSLVNSWRAYKNDCLANKYPRNKTLDLLDFRLEIAEVLLNSPDKQRRSSDEDTMEINVPKKFKKAIKPSISLRYDGYNHLPQFDDLKSPRACQNENCKSRTKTRCIKCNAYLCIARNQNCFKDFHSA
ncbi:piggyBac transposable element-derived protein 3-like isoform X1 [Amyelois transitella]|uniref:piggyBac transposable element-derived protein 3-like n=1 Tax=Amyelois transitella TaxID=680683 RepID=UPI00298FD533|nr:piggyBac transposable element-derived protein 3-like [Amyelois transitella]XP_060804998.1 piggyBac transposable element-derived protein 3-like [Amyelois transitella]XP_060808502.1 piggyBac transposable element-derived protein 3-like isoform X1 [Amyelois transitella]XP_060809278.1 piggyBac transposable element-derived protein 3-like isoform X1 [Amyelois transitella]XP_060809689.1 piggyBac transposable element-derived protein 3-like isoform X1 [Amyelois transitella]XP_060810181.1 piggyBac tra